MKTDLDLLKRLVEIPSETPDVPQCNRATALLREWLESRGLHCTVENLDGREFLCAATTPGKVHDYLFNAHLDVVPATPELYTPRIEGDKLLARGSSDCKGAAVVIAQVLCAMLGKADVGAVFSTDEETGGATSAEAVRLGYDARKMIGVIDSAPYMITTAHKGIVDLRLVGRGKNAHSSLPWEGENAIDRLLDGYAKLRAAWPKNAPGPDGSEWFDTYSAVIVSGGTAHNKVPDEASLLVNIRYTVPGDEDRIEAFVRETTGLDVVRETCCQPFVCDEKEPVFGRLADIMRRIWPDKGVGFVRMNGATDARHFGKSKAPIAVLGIDGGSCHTDAEWVGISGIGEMADVLCELCLG
jgi:succinyl-diaminopimelate desuccinylase